MDRGQVVRGDTGKDEMFREGQKKGIRAKIPGKGAGQPIHAMFRACNPGDPAAKR